MKPTARQKETQYRVHGHLELDPTGGRWHERRKRWPCGVSVGEFSKKGMGAQPQEGQVNQPSELHFEGRSQDTSQTVEKMLW